MKTTRESKKLSSSSLILAALSALMLTGLISKEASAAITCTTNFGERSFTIEHNSVAFHSQKDGRSISSTVDSVTKKTHTGFKKTIYKDGYRNLIHIEDQNNFNSNNDFLAITSPKGHKMTFPINCSLL